MLEVKDLYVGYYRDLNILQGISIEAEKEKITTVLGANGVGKSTLLKAIYGFLEPNDGEILLEGEDVGGVPTHKLIELGISYIPQQPGKNYERFPAIKDRRRSQAGELSGGMQRMVELGRTLMTDPKIILVDEPSAGLAKLLSEMVYQMLVDLRDNDGMTIILVDQEIRQALKIADYVYVLELGRNKFEGPVEDFTDPQDLKKAFWA
jgi:branched-chain amino acid transport system ATP-binding protein